MDMAKAKKGGEVAEAAPEGNIVLDHLAAFITEQFINEDVNAFAEANLMHELLVYKLNEVAKPMMQQTVEKAGKELKKAGKIDLKKRVSGINQQKRIMFRNEDQYNALISLFFDAVEEKPELVGFIDDETSFENFMIYCINDYRDQWEQFVNDIIQDRLGLERKYKLYANRNRADPVWEKVPTYADYIADRIDDMASPAA
jgi:DNA-binding transcriptional ArsR family regulator